MKKCSFTLNTYIFYLPRRIMDPCSIYISELPRHLTYAEIKGAFWPFQTTPKLNIIKKENYVIIEFQKEETIQEILQEKDNIKIRGKSINIQPATKKFNPTYVHLPPSFRLPPDVIFKMLSANAPPPAPTSTAPTASPAPYQHPFPEGFSYFYFK